MARVTGPLHSDTASGTLNGSMTFAKWKGRAYVRTTVTPTNPKTPRQIGVRAMMQFLAQAWASIAATPKASWNAIAATRMISGFNSYVAAGLAEWQTLTAPQQAYNAAKTSTALTVTTQAATGSKGSATINVTPSAATNIWGVMIFRGLTGFVPSYQNAIAVLQASSAAELTFVDSPVAAGTYAYRSAVFTTDGVLGTIHAESAGIVIT